MSDSVFIFHLVSQTRANIDFLQAQGYLTADDAATVQSKLAAATVKTSEKSANLPVSTPQPFTPAPSYQLHPPIPPQPPQPTPSYPRARALWAYNEDGRVRNLAEVVQHLVAHAHSQGTERPDHVYWGHHRYRRGVKSRLVDRSQQGKTGSLPL